MMALTEWLHRSELHCPDVTALIYGDRRFCYRELKDCVSQLAGGFSTFDLKPDSRICILSLNSDHAIISFWAAIWAGHLPNFLNSRWSGSELSAAINDCQASVLLIDENFLPIANELKNACPSIKQWVFLGKDIPMSPAYNFPTIHQLINDSQAIEDQSGSSDEDAFLNYTGGTTAKGKGVVHTHSSLTAALNSCFAEQAFRHNSTLCLVVPLFHISGILSMSATLRSGGTLVIMPSFKPTQILAAISEHTIDSIVLVPTMCQLLISDKQFETFDISALKNILYGGSPISSKLLADLLEALPHAQLMQVYGQTEGAPVSFLHPADHVNTDHKALISSAGNIAYGIDVEIKDRDGNVLNEGEIGEVCFSGPQTMSRYWNQLELTSETKKGEWCCTGDAGYLQKGYLFIVDRIKDMIVTGGENVYSTEVEAALITHPAVSQCAVIGLTDEIWGERVHACIVLASDSSIELEAIQQHCKNKLADYKTPKSFSILEALPLTAVGKIDKVTLRKLNNK